MFDWPVATVILGVLGTLTAAILKMPQRRVVENMRGEPCASKQDVKELKDVLLQRASKDDLRTVVQNQHEHQKYTETRNHDILNALDRVQGTIILEVKEGNNEKLGILHTLNSNVVRLLERTRNKRVQDDDN